MAHSIDDLPALLVEQLPRASHEARSATQDELATMRADVGASMFSGSVSLGEALELYSLVRELRPETTLEIGMFTAASTLAILKGLGDNEHGTHYVCDPFQGTYAQNAGLRNVEESALGDRMRFVEAFPEEAVPGWPTAGFAFIDGSHLFDLTILDFVLVDKRLAPGGLVGLHDLWMPSLQKVVRWAVTNRGYEVVAERRAPLGRRQRARSLLARAAPSTRRGAHLRPRAAAALARDRAVGGLDDLPQEDARRRPRLARPRAVLAPLRDATGAASGYGVAP